MSTVNNTCSCYFSQYVDVFGCIVAWKQLIHASEMELMKRVLIFTLLQNPSPRLD